MKKKWPFIFHTLFIWVMYIMMLYVAKFAIPETASLSMNAVLISFVIGTFSYAATNGGIGAYPIAIHKRYYYMVFLKVEVLVLDGLCGPLKP